jgi:hypothetical protein
VHAVRCSAQEDAGHTQCSGGGRARRTAQSSGGGCAYSSLLAGDRSYRGWREKSSMQVRSSSPGSGSEEDYAGGTQAPLWDESGDDDEEPVQL